MKILKQQSSLCSLFSAASIFKPNMTLVEMQDLILKYKIRVELGLTIPQENLILLEFTNFELQLVPKHLDYSNALTANQFEKILNIKKEIPEDQCLVMALLVDYENMVHRIWIIIEAMSRIIIVDTRFEETTQVETINELVSMYSIVGIFALYSISLVEEILMNKKAIGHLIG